MNEKVGKIIEYPIKYDTEDGSVWVEREIIDQLIQWDMMIKSGAWFSFSEETLAELKEKKFKVENKFQGEESLLNYLENNKEITEYFFKKFKQTLESLS